jgi:hypothetical protein
MRKLALLVLLALAVPVAALAAPADRGDGTLAVKNATGRMTVTAKGVMLGRVEDGQIVVADLSPNLSADIQVFGYDSKPVVKQSGATVYRGTGLRFRIIGGWYQVIATGVGVNLSAVGTGAVVGQGVSAGLFSVDALPFSTTTKGALFATFGQT